MLRANVTFANGLPLVAVSFILCVPSYAFSVVTAYCEVLILKSSGYPLSKPIVCVLPAAFNVMLSIAYFVAPALKTNYIFTMSFSCSPELNAAVDEYHVLPENRLPTVARQFSSAIVSP